VPSIPPQFGDAFRSDLRALFEWRRDVRRFRRDPLPAGMLERLLAQAVLAPSVGLSQPWRFVTVEDTARRERIGAAFRASNQAALERYRGDAAERYAALKLAGLAEAPTHLAVFADRGTSVGKGLGRRTMPETAEYSVVTAVHTLWLAARAEGIGMGWVSILDRDEVALILDVPGDWRFIGYFCLGYPSEEDDIPELERQDWESRRPLASFLLRR
jgi:5,6-dimethylbenzimidazole synthase